MDEMIRILNGSRLYGTFGDDSDHDYIGIFVEPAENVFSGKKLMTVPIHKRGPDQRNLDGHDDGMSYSLRHFTSLALAGNPSLLTVLYSPELFWVHSTAHGRLFMSHASDFTSIGAAPKFRGYLESQIGRLRGIKKGHIPNRPEIVEKYGYDTKYAMSAARLGLQGIEYFRTGSVVSPMKQDDIEYLLFMRTGGFSYEECIHELFKIDVHLTSAIEKSRLPSQPNYNRVYKLIKRIHLETWDG